MGVLPTRDFGLIHCWRGKGKSVAWIVDRTGLTVDQVRYQLRKHEFKKEDTQSDSPIEPLEYIPERPGLQLLFQVAHRSSRQIASGSSTGSYIKRLDD